MTIHAGAEIDHEKIRTLASACDLEIAFRTEAQSQWREVEERIAYLPVSYAADMIAYQTEYFNGNRLPMTDVSLLLLHNAIPIGIAPLSLQRKDGASELNTCGSGIYEPLFAAGASEVQIGKKTGAYYKFVLALAEALHSGFPRFKNLSNPHQASISVFHKLLLQNNYAPHTEYDVFVDLSWSLDAIWTSLRKSYKSLINKAQGLWQLDCIDGACVRPWSEFKNLHIQVAGRVTRSDQSWQLQREMVENGSALLITLRNRGGEMVGAGFFQHTHSEALYSVAAYDRSLFEQPLGHLVLWEAIQYYKKRGVQWFNIGQRFFGFEAKRPTQKEIDISVFKSGFGTHFVPHNGFVHYHEIE